MHTIWTQFLTGMYATTWLEFIAVIFGIISVWLSRKEHIGVYPTGIINTGLFIYLSLKAGLYAEAGVNVYYTVVSLIGWYMWSKKGDTGAVQLKITQSSSREWAFALSFFCLCWAVLYLVLDRFTDSTVPMADAFAAGAAYTGMWLMARKKLENWLWWIVTNLASIPLYFIKGYVFTSVQFLVFLILAIWGYFTWRQKINSSV